jgi:hypothetical protein
MEKVRILCGGLKNVSAIIIILLVPQMMQKGKHLLYTNSKRILKTFFKVLAELNFNKISDVVW